MAQITLKQSPVETVGELPPVGAQAPSFVVTGQDLNDISLSDFAGKKVVLNIFPSIDTGTCAASVRRFNQEAAKLGDVAILCISADLPFAAARFCGAEGIDNVVTGSVFRNPSFGDDYGVTFKTGPLTGLLSRSLVVIDESGNIIYTQQVPETVDEPDYEPTLAALKS